MGGWSCDLCATSPQGRPLIGADIRIWPSAFREQERHAATAQYTYVVLFMSNRHHRVNLNLQVFKVEGGSRDRSCTSSPLGNLVIQWATMTLNSATPSQHETKTGRDRGTIDPIIQAR